MGNTKFPFGDAAAEAVTGTGAKALTISDNLTIVTCSSLTGNVTLNLTFDQGLEVGAKMIIHAIQGGTGRNVVLGTGFAASAADLTGVANDEDIIELFYNGTSFVNLSAWTKIVDAA